MKIGLLIDHLGSGGAQRQMAYLAVGLNSRGFEVTIITYRSTRFFDEYLEAAGVSFVRLNPKNKMSRLVQVRRAVIRLAPKVLIAFLDAPSLYGELVRLSGAKFKLIVSERTGKVGKASAFDRFRFQLHRIADAIVTNSEDLKNFVIRYAPHLREKLFVIRNGVDLDKFSPANCTPKLSEGKILIVGRMQRVKNAFFVLEGLKQLHDELKSKITIDWYGNNFFVDGRSTKRSEYYLELTKQVAVFGMKSSFRLHAPQANIEDCFRTASVFCLPSLYEGCPNSLIEAMACGVPAIVSNVCDNDLLVRDGVNGFLFDPLSLESFKTAVAKMYSLSPAEYTAMRSRSREIAVKLFDPEKMVDSYVDLANRLTK